MEFFIIAIAVAFNYFVIQYKFQKKRYADGILDISLLCIITFLFAGSFGGLVVATVASAIISVLLFIFPPKLPNFKPPSL